MLKAKFLLLCQVSWDKTQNMIKESKPNNNNEVKQTEIVNTKLNKNQNTKSKVSLLTVHYYICQASRDKTQNMLKKKKNSDKK